jgi:hypothetical protein
VGGEVEISDDVFFSFPPGVLFLIFIYVGKRKVTKRKYWSTSNYAGYVKEDFIKGVGVGGWLLCG